MLASQCVMTRASMQLHAAIAFGHGIFEKAPSSSSVSKPPGPSSSATSGGVTTGKLER
jgi:hypothetical protein